MSKMRTLLTEFKSGLLLEREGAVKVNIRDLWRKGSTIFEDECSDEEFIDFKEELMPRLKGYIEKINSALGEEAATDYENIVKELDAADDLIDFNYAGEDMYDFGDLYSVFLVTF